MDEIKWPEKKRDSTPEERRQYIEALRDLANSFPADKVVQQVLSDAIAQLLPPDDREEFVRKLVEDMRILSDTFKDVLDVLRTVRGSGGPEDESGDVK
jgi:uncharacterized protein (DUF2236 family)